MSRIVLGIGTSHSPLLAIDPALWEARGRDDELRSAISLTDGRMVSYASLAEEIGERYVDEATLENFTRQSAAAQSALDRLAAAIRDAEPDLLIVIGDDQDELFGRSHLPAFALYTGDELITLPKNLVVPGLPEWNRAANKGYGMDGVNRYPADPAFATFLAERLIDRGVDVSLATKVENPFKAGFGHAYGFIAERLLGDRAVPIVPVMLNTYFPPNVPTPARCHAIGGHIAAAVTEHPGDLRIAIVASGGLTHFHTDEPFDRALLDALHRHDASYLGSLQVSALRSGNSEILNWIMAAGALTGLEVDFAEYIPVRRAAAGTGIGLGFVTWLPCLQQLSAKGDQRP